MPGVSSLEAKALGLTRRLTANYQRACEEQANHAPPGARACPRLVPGGRLKVVYAEPFPDHAKRPGGFVAELASPSLGRLGHERIETNGGHWRYEVSWTRAVRHVIVDRGVERPADAGRRSSCRRTRLGGQAVDACRVVPYEQGGGINGGHIVYVWSLGASTYVISVHGYRNEPRARAMMAALIAEVLDRSGRP
jgi:hypothetical protein